MEGHKVHFLFLFFYFFYFLFFLRSTFSPIFTSGKMKGMMKYIKLVAGGLGEEIDRKVAAGEEFELKEVFGKFSLDALASCAFGIDAESFSSSESQFVDHAATIFGGGLVSGVGQFLRFVPGMGHIFKFFNINIFYPKSITFFRDIVLQTLKTRKESKERRNDLIDLILDSIKDDKGGNEDDEEDEDQYHRDMKFSHKKQKSLDDMSIVSNLLLLLVVGYDTTGMTLSYLAYAMAKHPDIQEKLQEEIDQAFDDAGDKFPDYNTIQSLPYLDMIIHETLRFYNPTNMTARACTQDYKIPGTDIVVKRNDMISFAGAGYHKDPRYYSHPDQFYPEHFSKEEKATRNPHAFQGFGQGPRACLGMRFALSPGTKTIEPLVLDPKAVLNWVKGGLWATV